MRFGLFSLILICSLAFAQVKYTTSGFYYTIAVREDNSLWLFGRNNFYSPDTIPIVDSPIPLEFGSNYTSIAAGASMAIGIQQNGSLWGWGFYSIYADDYDETPDMVRLGLKPTQIGTDTDWASVSVGCYHVLAIKKDSSLWGFGNDSDGELGTGRLTGTRDFVPIGIDKNWKRIATACSRSVALKSDGSLWTWGSNGYASFPIESPIQIMESSDWINVQVNDHLIIAQKSDGTLWSWERNTMFLDSLSNKAKDTIFIKQISADTDWASFVTERNRLIIAIKNNGTLWVLGRSNLPVLGLGEEITEVTAFTQIGTDTDWASVSVNYGHSVGVKKDGSLWVWGNVPTKGDTESYEYSDKGIFIAIPTFDTKYIPTRVEFPATAALTAKTSFVRNTIHAQVNGNHIQIKNLPANTEVEVFDIHGKKIYFSNTVNTGLSVKVSAKGIYVIRAGGQILRVAVK
ncbi:MAG: hypothetical protein LBR60_06045 [Fibrobacter sp.]|jgi:alpha-tubulin suppressor-like RCC1 family protein|nr:hypothetical protein [Fibrobacter sp.]